MQQFPDEINLVILSYVDDIDLQTLLKANREFRALASDPILWLEHKHNNELKIDQKLKKRPEIVSLVHSNIIKSDNQQHLLQTIANGNYNQVFIHSQYNLNYLLQLYRNQRVLNKLFRDRKTPIELGIFMPLGPYASPNLQPQALKLSKLFRKQKLSRLIKSASIRENPFLKEVKVTDENSLFLTQMTLQRMLTNKQTYGNLLNENETDKLKFIPDRYLAPLVCSNVKTKIKYFEGNM
jgi:hypothetical protein